jgi:hypothetical protein
MWFSQRPAPQPEYLIVVCEHGTGGSPLDVARDLACANDAPILAVTTDRFIFERSLPAGANVDGPYLLSELDSALASSRAIA